MKIERKIKKKMVPFGTLKSGQLFEYHSRLMIKMSDSEEDDAFDLDYHTTVILVKSSMVLPLNATLTIED